MRVNRLIIFDFRLTDFDLSMSAVANLLNLIYCVYLFTEDYNVTNKSYEYLSPTTFLPLFIGMQPISCKDFFATSFEIHW